MVVFPCISALPFVYSCTETPSVTHTDMNGLKKRDRNKQSISA
jgi:hypothetical protein